MKTAENPRETGRAVSKGSKTGESSRKTRKLGVKEKQGVDTQVGGRAENGSGGLSSQRLMRRLFVHCASPHSPEELPNP